MPYANYLLSMAAALRDEVAPAIDDLQARDAVEMVLRTLTTIATIFEAAERPAEPCPEPLRALPGNRAALPAAAGVVPAAGVYLPRRSPHGDMPGGGANHDDIVRAAGAIAGGICDAKSVAAIVAWESDLRRRMIERADTLLLRRETGDAAAGGISRGRLQDYLRHRFAAPALQIVDFRIIPGGRSRQTALLSIGGADHMPRDMVCQRDNPSGINPDASVARQYLILEKAHAAGVRVPLPIAFEEGCNWLDAPFLLVEKAAGSAPVHAGSDYFVPRPKDARLARSLAVQMGRLHAIPAAQLTGIDHRPDVARPRDWCQDIDKIADQWRRFSPAPSATIEAAFGWLYRHIDCIETLTVLAHTDMLLHNVLVQDGEVSAVLDWESAQIGHPGQDLGYVFPVIQEMTDWSSFMGAYISAGGNDIGLEQVTWFSIRAMLLYLAMVQPIGEMISAGQASDIRLAETAISWGGRLIDRIASVLQPALDLEAAGLPPGLRVVCNRLREESASE